MNEISIVGISLGVELLVHNCDNSNILRNIRLNMGCLYIYFILFTFLSTMTQYLQYKLVLLLLILKWTITVVNCRHHYYLALLRRIQIKLLDKTHGIVLLSKHIILTEKKCLY